MKIQPLPARDENAVLERLAAPAGSSLPLPRALMIFAHPDDEVLAVGGRLERMSASRLFTLTDGAPLNGTDAHHHGFSTLAAYRQAREAELGCALARAGLGPEIAAPFAQQVPDQTAALHLVSLTLAVAASMEACSPEVVLTHPYEGGHPDHDACAFIVHHAARIVRQRGSIPDSLIAEAPFYNADDAGRMRTGTFLPHPNNKSPVIAELSAPEQEEKRARLACFSSQAETLAQFGVQREMFRPAPSYDFTLPPHPGPLLYEVFAWGMTGASFRQLAADAAAQLADRGTAAPSDAAAKGIARTA